MFYPRVRLPKDETVDKVDHERRDKILSIGMENLERMNQLSRDAYEDGKSDDSAQLSELVGDWYDRLTGR